jgi:hypothetical protein
MRTDEVMDALPSRNEHSGFKVYQASSSEIGTRGYAPPSFANQNDDEQSGPQEEASEAEEEDMWARMEREEAEAKAAIAVATARSSVDTAGVATDAQRPPSPEAALDETTFGRDAERFPRKERDDNDVGRKDASSRDPRQGFEPGARVELTGLKAKPELNGTRGVITGWVAGAGRYLVDMDNGKGSFNLQAENLSLVQPVKHTGNHLAARGVREPTSVFEDPSAPLIYKVDNSSLVGTRVELHSLQAKPELNGCHGLVMTFITSSGRYSVVLDADVGTFDLKPGNLKPSSQTRPVPVHKQEDEGILSSSEFKAAMAPTKDEQASRMTPLDILRQRFKVDLSVGDVIGGLVWRHRFCFECSEKRILLCLETSQNPTQTGNGSARQGNRSRHCGQREISPSRTHWRQAISSQYF